MGRQGGAGEVSVEPATDSILMLMKGYAWSRADRFGARMCRAAVVGGAGVARVDRKPDLGSFDACCVP